MTIDFQGLLKVAASTERREETRFHKEDVLSDYETARRTGDINVASKVRADLEMAANG